MSELNPPPWPIVVAMLLIALVLFGIVSCNNKESVKPPTSPIVNITKIVEFKNSNRTNCPYDISSVDPDTKQLVTRRRWFDRVVADVEPDKNPWAEIKTKSFGDGTGNVLHVHNAKEITVLVENVQ